MATEQKSFVVNATVFQFTEAKPDNKTHQVQFVLDGTLPEGCLTSKPLVYADKSVWSAEDFKEDAKGEMTFEMVPKKEPNQFFYTLTKWNGKEKAPFDGNRNRQRGGGGYQKSVDEVHGSNIAGIIKSSIEACLNAGLKDKNQIDAVCEIGQNQYFSGIEKARSITPTASAPKEEAK